MKKYVLKIDEKDSIGFSGDIMDMLKLIPGDEVEVRCSPHRLSVEKCAPFCLICEGREHLNEMGNNVFMCDKCLKSLNEALKRK